MLIQSLYWHYPYCRHLCNYCDFFKVKADDYVQQHEKLHQFYIDSWQEHEMLMQSYGIKWGELKTLYLGGGTPSLWKESGVSFLRENILNRLKLAPDCEFALEIDPGTWDTKSFNAWRSLGVNRFSLGLQSLNPDFLKIADRLQTLEESYQVLELFKQNNLNFSADFLLGLPFSREKKRNIIKELEEVLRFNPKHISLYILTVPTGYLHFSQLPEDEWIRSEYLEVSDFLKSKGFEHYEVSNFAKPGFHSKNNFVYWSGKSFAAIGPSATGYYRLAHDKAYRFKWGVSNVKYKGEELGKKEIELEELYVGLRTNQGLELDQFPKVIIDKFKQWQERDLAVLTDKNIFLNSKGFVILDSLMDELFALKAI